MKSYRPTYQQDVNAYSYCITCTRYRFYFSTHILAYLHTLLIVSIHLFSKFVNVLLVKMIIFHLKCLITLILEKFNYSASEHVFKDKCSRKYVITAGPGNVYIPW